MTHGRRWSGRALTAGLVLPALLLAQACVSVDPWRPCEVPCKDFERAERVEICKTDGVPIVFTRARGGEDEHGYFISGKAKTRLGQPLGKVKVYDDEINMIWTQRVEAGRVATNVALVPVAMVFMALTGGGNSNDLDEDLWQDPTPECPPPSTPPAPGTTQP
jgi:hypothetical protein